MAAAVHPSAASADPGSPLLVTSYRSRFVEVVNSAVVEGQARELAFVSLPANVAAHAAHAHRAPPPRRAARWAQPLAQRAGAVIVCDRPGRLSPICQCCLFLNGQFTLPATGPGGTRRRWGGSCWQLQRRYRAPSTSLARRAAAPARLHPGHPRRLCKLQGRRGRVPNSIWAAGRVAGHVASRHSRPPLPICKFAIHMHFIRVASGFSQGPACTDTAPSTARSGRSPLQRYIGHEGIVPSLPRSAGAGSRAAAPRRW